MTDSRLLKGDLDGAIADCDRALEMKPRNTAAYANRGVAKQTRGDYDGAIADHSRILEINANSAAACKDRADAKLGKGDFAGAIADCSRALQINPNYAEAYNSRGAAKRVAGDLDGAFVDYYRALEVNANYAFAYNNRGNVKKEKGDLDGAIADYNLALKLNPRLADAYGNRGLVKDVKGDCNGAIADYDHALQIDPAFVNAYCNRAIAKKNKGDLDGARTDLRRAWEMEPTGKEQDVDTVLKKPGVVSDVFLFRRAHKSVNSYGAGISPSPNPLEKTARRDSSDPLRSVVLIQTDRGRGTGFVCRFGQRKYVLSNAHVIEGAKTIGVWSMSQERLSLTSLEIAGDRDLVRLGINEQQLPAIDLSEGLPAFGENVSVLGNSEGAGVVTKIEGKVQSVGPALIETDAAFVSGNSGSPIINTNNQVIAVATFITRINSTNWITEGTRFLEPRKFGVRVAGVKWQPVSFREFQNQTQIIADAKRFYGDCCGFARLMRNSPCREIPSRLKTVSSKIGGYIDQEYENLLRRFCGELVPAFAAFEAGYSTRSYSVDMRYRQAIITYKQFPTVPLRKLRGISWCSTYYQQQAKTYAEAFESLDRNYYCTWPSGECFNSTN